MATILDMAEARANLADITNRVVYNGERMEIHRRGKPVMAMISIDEYNLLMKLGQIVPLADLSSAIDQASKPKIGKEILMEALMNSKKG